jgi:hypothetical protein
MAAVRNPRRYCLLKSRALDANDMRELAAAFRGKQDAITGTPLPGGVPHQAALAAARYTTVEDLDGADVDELVDQGFPRAHALAVIRSLT